MQFYDPNTLIAEVQELLRSYGLNPQLVDSQLAQTGARRIHEHARQRALAGR